MTITTLRPTATSSGSGWSAVPSGTLHAVTSDDSDSTYALWSGTGAPLVLQTPLDAPPIGERRHQVRVRVRGEDGSAWWAVRTQAGLLTGGASATLPAAPATVSGSWGFGVPHDGNTILAAHIEGQTTGVKITEVYVDMDSRLAPTFTPQVLDGSGTATTTITDTSTPVLHASDLDLDGLAQRQYRYWVTAGATVVWDSGILSGAYTDQATAPLGNGSYTAHLQIWTTLGASTAYASEVETLAFTVAVGDIPIPNDPGAAPIEGTPLYEVQVCAPDMGDFDTGTGHVELQRIDCAGSDTERATSLAMLGPLATDECTTWTDFTVPRTGLGGTCDHPPEECCSYYRARTIGRIGGKIVISAWSDVRDSGVPAGLIFFWPSTNASIPSGWKRTTALDGRYAKGIATASTQPGATGGAATHTHTTPGHAHDLTHFHGVTGNTSAAVGTVTSGPNAVGTLGVPATHTHNRSSVNGATVSSQVTAPAIASVSNDPARLDVLHIQSLGTPDGVPDGALGITADVSLPGWTDYANANGRFMKGAAAGGNGGGTAASALPSHTHAIGAHTHGGTSHTHISPNTFATSGSLALNSGPNQATWATSHSHPVLITSVNTAALDSGGAGASGTASPDEPPFRNLRVKQNTSGGNSLPVGIIGAWRGSLGTIPAHWKLCDGTAGTPDLIGRYPKGATASIGATGGSTDTHTHTSPSHTHTTTGHTHPMSIGPQDGGFTGVQAVATVTVANGTHTHTGSNTDSTTPTVGSSTSGTLAAVDSEPPHEEVAFVQLVEEPTPEPDPEVFCLTWNEGEHLVRTLGPDGVMWAPVIGKVSWVRNRPRTVATGVNGGRFTSPSIPGERDFRMIAAVESQQELDELTEILHRPLVLVSPSDSTEVWAAPIVQSFTVIKVGRIREVTCDFIGTGPQPGPQVADL